MKTIDDDRLNTQIIDCKGVYIRDRDWVVRDSVELAMIVYNIGMASFEIWEWTDMDDKGEPEFDECNGFDDEIKSNGTWHCPDLEVIDKNTVKFYKQGTDWHWKRSK